MELFGGIARERWTELIVVTHDLDVRDAIDDCAVRSTTAPCDLAHLTRAWTALMDAKQQALPFNIDAQTKPL